MKTDRHNLDIIDSTNAWAKKNVSSFDPEALTVVTAKEQTASYGRFNRKWLSPPSNLCITFCVFMPTMRSDTPNIPPVLLLSVVDILEEEELKPTIKWPNDILIGDKKLGGVLCETTPVNGQRAVIIGLGLNVNMEEKELKKIGRPATSLYVETGADHNIDDVIERLEKQFANHLETFLKEGFKPFRDRFAEFLNFKKGAKLRFNDFKNTWEGIFHSLNADNSINIELPLHEIRTFFAGEILE